MKYKPQRTAFILVHFGLFPSLERTLRRVHSDEINWI